MVRYGSRCSSGGANKFELPASRIRSRVDPERGGDSTNTARSFFGVPSSARSRTGKRWRKVASLAAVTRSSSGIEVTRCGSVAAGAAGAAGTPSLSRPATNSAIWRTVTSSMYFPPCISRSWKPSLVLNSLSMATAIWMKSIEAKPTSPTMVVSGPMPPSISTSQSSVRSAITPMTRCSTASTVCTCVLPRKTGWTQAAPLKRRRICDRMHRRGMNPQVLPLFRRESRSAAADTRIQRWIFALRCRRRRGARTVAQGAPSARGSRDPATRRRQAGCPRP